MSALTDYLDRLEGLRSTEELERFLLWPRTPLDDDEYQSRITQRVGVSDRDADHPSSRPARLAGFFGALVGAGQLPEDFSVADIACGDALVLLHLQRVFPESACLGIDLNADRFRAHAELREAGGSVHRVLMQDLFAEQPTERFDVAMMLNTYRGWESADLPEEDRDLPERADAWLEGAARHIVLTVRRDQIAPWRDRGFHVTDIGPGEDDSRLVHVARERLPRSLAARAAVYRRTGRGLPVITMPGR